MYIPSRFSLGLRFGDFVMLWYMAQLTEREKERKREKEKESERKKRRRWGKRRVKRREELPFFSDSYFFRS